MRSTLKFKLYMLVPAIAAFTSCRSESVKEKVDIRTERPLPEMVSPVAGNRLSVETQPGIITYDPNSRKVISSRTSGRIERLYLKYHLQPVHKGQKIMEIYSPDIAAAQQELLYLKGSADPNLLQAARRKLSILGLSSAQISGILKSGKIQSTVPVFSPYTGFVLGAAAIPESNGPAVGSTIITSGSEMEEMALPAPGARAAVQTARSAELSIKEGQYLKYGDMIAEVVDTRSVWAEFYVPAGKIGQFAKGTEILVQSADVSDKSVRSRVSSVQPFYKDGINYSLVRATINSGDSDWKIGEILSISPDNKVRSGLWLPRTAVLDLGGRKVVFIRSGKGLQPREVSVRSSAGDWLNVEGSLDENVKVAKNAWFIKDSEGFVNIN